MIAARKRAGLPDWLVIARREFLERVRTPWFVIVTLLGPILMIGVMVLPVILATSMDERSKVQIVDASGKLGGPIGEELAKLGWTSEVVATDTREAVLLDRIADGTIDGFLTIPADGLAPGVTIDYQGENATSQLGMLILYRSVTNAVQTVRAVEAGLPRAKLEAVMAPVSVSSRHTTGEGPGASGQALLIVSYAVLFVLYMAIVLYATNVMRSVVQEKTNRVVEIMVAAAKPRALMLGKILGVGGAGLIQIAAWTGMAFLTLTFREELLGLFGVAGAGGWSLPPLGLDAFAVILAYFLLGYFFYASLYAAIGAMVSSEQEAQQAQTPVILLLIVPMMCMQLVANDPRGGGAQLLTTLPFSSPILMPMRYLLDGASGGQVALSLGILAASTWLVAWLASRIYRVGILLYGKRPSLRELARWIRYS